MSAEISMADRAITRTDLFLRACRCEPVPRAPVWMMRQAGRYLPQYREIRKKHPFLEVAKTPELAAEVSLQPFRQLGVDAVIVFSDILIASEAMGLPLECNDGGPVLPEPIRTEAQVARLRDFDPEVETRFVCDAIRLLRRELGPDIPVIGFAAAPWTLACYMVDGRGRARISGDENDDVQRATIIPAAAGADCERDGEIFAGANRGGRDGGATFRYVGWRIECGGLRDI